MKNVRCLLFITAMLLCTSTSVLAQIVQAGLKTGFQYSWVQHDDTGFKKIVKSAPVPGYNVGGVLSFKVKDRFFWHTEWLYSTKGREHNGIKERALNDKATYTFIEVPMLYNVFFKGHLKGGRSFKWYAGAGPLFSYWLGGHGTVFNGEFIEENMPPLTYKLVFGKRPENIYDVTQIYVKDTKRFQLGVNVGGGVMLEPNDRQRIMIDLRFEYGHTWIGTTESSDFVLPVSYEDNLKARNMGFRLSAMYLFEYNLSKKSRHKGKTTIKKRLKRPY